jgi:hypothetical protein
MLALSDLNLIRDQHGAVPVICATNSKEIRRAQTEPGQ